MYTKYHDLFITASRYIFFRNTVYRFLPSSPKDNQSQYLFCLRCWNLNHAEWARFYVFKWVLMTRHSFSLKPLQQAKHKTLIICMQANIEQRTVNHIVWPSQSFIIIPFTEPSCSVNGGRGHPGGDHTHRDRNVSSLNKGDHSEELQY